MALSGAVHSSRYLSRATLHCFFLCPRAAHGPSMADWAKSQPERLDPTAFVPRPDANSSRMRRLNSWWRKSTMYPALSEYDKLRVWVSQAVKSSQNVQLTPVLSFL